MKRNQIFIIILLVIIIAIAGCILGIKYFNSNENKNPIAQTTNEIDSIKPETTKK